MSFTGEEKYRSPVTAAIHETVENLHAAGASLKLLTLVDKKGLSAIA